MRASWTENTSCFFVLGALVPCHLASKMVGFGLLSMTGRGGPSDHSGKTASTLDAHAPFTRHWNPQTYAALCPNSTELFANQGFLMMNTRTPNCLMVLRPSISSTTVSLVVGSAGGMRRGAGVQHIVVLRADLGATQKLQRNQLQRNS